MGYSFFAIQFFADGNEAWLSISVNWKGVCMIVYFNPQGYQYFNPKALS